MGRNRYLVARSSVICYVSSSVMSRLFFLLASVAAAKATCDVGQHVNGNSPAVAKDSANFFQLCEDAIKDQVRIEFEASLQYLMGAHFDQDSVNLPGLSNFFYGHSDEERGHGIQFVEYLRMRGLQENDFFGQQPLKPTLAKYTWTDGLEALTDALSMEKMVAASIKSKIDICGTEDPQAADWLTGTWLKPQLEEQRELAGKINTLNRYRRDHEDLAEWLFDKEI